MIQTVCGNINSDDLGMTLPHENCLIDNTPWWKGIPQELSKRRLFNQKVTFENRGEVIERAAHIRLSDNVRFAFMLQEKALGIDEAFDASVDWWSCLQSSIKVRDRLTHPKLPGDIDITGEEVLTALQAFNGFKDQIMMYANERIE